MTALKFVLNLTAMVAISFLVACGSDSTDAPAVDPNTPTLSAIGDKSILQGGTFNFDINATDPNGDNLVFTMQALSVTDPRSLSPAANFTTNQNQTSANFNWTPNPSLFGEFTLQFTVTDDSLQSLSDSETITISVINRVAQGRILYRDNCGDCHGFEGQAGSTGITLSAPTTSTMQAAISAPTSSMGIAADAFSTDQFDMMYEYFCDLDTGLCG